VSAVMVMVECPSITDHAWNIQHRAPRRITRMA
jgi:hypothetical protein